MKYDDLFGSTVYRNDALTIKCRIIPKEQVERQEYDILLMDLSFSVNNKSGNYLVPVKLKKNGNKAYDKYDIVNAEQWSIVYNLLLSMGIMKDEMQYTKDGEEYIRQCVSYGEWIGEWIKYFN